VSAIVFKPGPAAQPASDVSEAVKHGVLNNTEMCAMELASHERSIEDGERITSGLRGIDVFDNDIRLDPVAKQEDALPLIALPGHDISKPVPRMQFMNTRAIVVLERPKQFITAIPRILDGYNNKTTAFLGGRPRCRYEIQSEQGADCNDQKPTAPNMVGLYVDIHNVSSLLFCMAIL
jgi:hypothetical protein